MKCHQQALKKIKYSAMQTLHQMLTNSIYIHSVHFKKAAVSPDVFYSPHNNPEI